MRRIFAKELETGATWSGSATPILAELSGRLRNGERWQIEVDGVLLTLEQIDAVLDRCRISGGEYMEPSEIDWIAAGVNSGNAKSV